ncbi:MAG: hypothetical protein CRN43_14690 [Candidatus Nephrothrix sp. EaCA]|nr:MAG: hypothetical protein CRN43_14690 [Candidatus Nephrothrix sp. EaCA]
MRLLGGQQNGQLTPNIFSEKEKGTFLRNGIHALASPRPIQKVSAAAFHKKKTNKGKKNNLQLELCQIYFMVSENLLKNLLLLLRHAFK